MMARIVAALHPFALAYAAALLVKGYSAVGDGFSAGAIAGLGAAIQYVYFDYEQARRRIGARHAPLLIAGPLLAALVLLLAPVLIGAAPVTHMPGPGSTVLSVGAVKLHTAMVFDMAVAICIYGCVVGTFDRLFPPTPDERS